MRQQVDMIVKLTFDADAEQSPQELRGKLEMALGRLRIANMPLTDFKLLSLLEEAAIYSNPEGFTTGDGRTIYQGERTLPAVSFDDLGDIPTLMQVAGYDYNGGPGFDERLRRLVALAAFEAIMLELGAERIARHTSARYRVFTQFGEWGASLDPEGKDICWLFTRFDEPGRVPMPAGRMNKHSGKWNHTLDVQDGKVEFLPFIYQCEALGLQSLTGDALTAERAAFEAREAEIRARYKKAFA